jgi:putative sigma-54 modulation protein
MKITIESPHIRISQKLQKLVHAKFSHLGKMYDRIVNCDVILKKENNDRQKFYTVEARLLVPKELLFAIEKAETFEIALTKLTDDLEHQLRRHKQELEKLH